jgi:hypothetical protein
MDEGVFWQQEDAQVKTKNTILMTQGKTKIKNELLAVYHRIIPISLIK